MRFIGAVAYVVLGDILDRIDYDCKAERRLSVN